MPGSSPEKPGSLLLIDECLADKPLAEALRAVDYNAVAERDQFGQGTEDPTLIQWLGLQGGIWVTADDKAKRVHSEEIRRANIHIVWVRRPKQGMSKKAQLLLLLWVLDPILEEISRARQRAEFEAYYSGNRPRCRRLR